MTCWHLNNFHTHNDSYCKDDTTRWTRQPVLLTVTLLHCVPIENIPDIIDCNLKKDYQILIIFDVNIPDTTGHQITIQVPTSSNVCFCTTWVKRNTRNTRWNEPKTSKNIPDIISCNEKDDTILIAFGTGISDRTGLQTTVRVSPHPTSVSALLAKRNRTSEKCVEMNKKRQ